MNVASHLKTRTALVFAAAAAVTALAVPGALAQPRAADDNVPRGAAPASGRSEDRVVPGFARPTRPDGPALRSVFAALATQAAQNRTHASGSHGSEIESAGAGFSWRDAGIGGGVVLLLGALAGLGFAASTHRWKKPARA